MVSFCGIRQAPELQKKHHEGEKIKIKCSFINLSHRAAQRENFSKAEA